MMDDIRDLFAFTRWADERILDACAALGGEELRRDMGSSFPSVLDTLVHIASSEWIWLKRWNGHSPTAPPDWAIADVAALRGHWGAVWADLATFLSGLAAGDLNRAVAYRNLRGDAFEAPLGQLMRHVVNHSTYHRGQVVTMLRQLGATPPPTDLVLYHRLHSPRLV